MTYYTCSACRYTFAAEKLPSSCPDCGKKTASGAPAIRSATEDEINEYKKNLEIIENEKW